MTADSSQFDWSELSTDRPTVADQVAERTQQLRAAILDSTTLDDLPGPDPLIGDLLFRDSIAWLQGKPGGGKSFVALDWSASVGAGMPWQGQDVPTRGPVLYIVAEGIAGIPARVRAWEAVTGQPMTGVHFLPVAVQLLDPVDLEALLAITRELHPVLIVVDTQARVTLGADENSSRDMGALVHAADRLRIATRACILLVHHEARAGDNLRGSSALDGAAETIIRVTKDGPHIRLDCRKQKNTPEFDPILLRLTPSHGSAVIQSHSGVGLDDDLNRTELALLQTMRDSFGTTGATGTTLRDTTAL